MSAYRLAPRPRYRIYGGFPNYLRFARDLLLGAHRRHREVAEWELDLAQHFGVDHAICAPMARVALFALLSHYGRAGQKVLLSPYTIVDVVNMVLAAGLEPVFVDVDPRTGNLDPEALRRASFANVCAVMVTHLHGITADIDEICTIAAAAGVPVIEDAAQCMGGRWGDRFVGTIGEAGVFSLGSYKNVNAWFGGIVVTRSAETDRSVRERFSSWPTFAVRHLVRKVRETAVTDALAAWPVFGHVLFPVFRTAFLNDWEQINRLLRIELDTRARPSLLDYYRGRFTDLQVRSARAQFGRCDAHAAERIRYARMYADGLRQLSGIVLPPDPDGMRHVYTYYPVQVNNRVALLKWLQHRGRDVAAQHLHNVASLKDFRRFGGECPVASRVAQSVVLLPTYPGYGDEQVRANIEVIQWYARAGFPDFR